MSEPYQKVGRGGAGNFYSKKDIEDITEHQAQDLEAQTNAAEDHTTHLPAQHDPYQKVGRGGAGNFVAPSEGERASALEGMHKTKELVKEKLHIGGGAGSSGASVSGTSVGEGRGTEVEGAKAPAYRGRGGAGNWAGEEDRAVAERERAEELRRVEVEERVRREVEGGLRAPPRAYSGEGRGDDDCF